MLGILTAVMGLGQTFLENKREKTKAKGERETELIKQAGSWEEIHAKGSHNSWKDEFWTIVFAIPLILCFIPSMTDVVSAGFVVLDSTPEWYRYTVGVLVGSSVGIRQFNKFKAGK
ncbi:hypothetical protein N9924_01305 [bacterium]|nr:hypothetical protein [bacterium]